MLSVKLVRAHGRKTKRIAGKTTKQMQPQTTITKDQALRFLKKVVADNEVKIKVTMFTDKSEWAYGAWVNVTPDNKKMTVRLNRDLESDVRCILLHEAGHLKGSEVHGDSLVERELSAQMWAIERAKELGWARLSEELEDQLKNRWVVGNYNWNSGYRRYILASRLAKKRGLI